MSSSMGWSVLVSWMKLSNCVFMLLMVLSENTWGS